MTLGEIFSKAAVNTLLGMGTVFTVLILISGVIALLKYIPGTRPAPEKEKPDYADPQTVLPSGRDGEDGLLAAVIMAAIMASEGVQEGESGEGASPYIVRSIRRRE
ncbi:MAG: OadG family protein [Emergencia sp.]